MLGKQSHVGITTVEERRIAQGPGLAIIIGIKEMSIGREKIFPVNEGAMESVCSGIQRRKLPCFAVIRRSKKIVIPSNGDRPVRCHADCERMDGIAFTRRIQRNPLSARIYRDSNHNEREPARFHTSKFTTRFFWGADI